MGALALMLALAQGGTRDERAAVAGALAARDHAAAFDLPSASLRLRGALAAANAAGGPFNLAEARARRTAGLDLRDGAGRVGVAPPKCPLVLLVEPLAGRRRSAQSRLSTRQERT